MRRGCPFPGDGSVAQLLAVEVSSATSKSVSGDAEAWKQEAPHFAIDRPASCTVPRLKGLQGTPSSWPLRSAQVLDGSFGRI